VADPAEGRRVNLRNHARHPLLTSLTANPSSRLSTYGLFAAGAYDRDLHRELKAAWLPFFAGAGLDACVGEMAAGADLLGDRLAEAAAAGTPVDVWRLFGSLTLTVVSACAFGLDMPTGIDGGASSPEAAALLDAARTIFATGRSSSAWALVHQALPWAAPLIRLATRLAPGPALAALDGARGVIMAKGMELVLAERERQGAEEGEGEEAAAAPSKKGSFLSLFARRARRAADRGDAAAAAALFNPDVVVAQCFTFLLAGYETTATALAFCVHHLSTHPAAAARAVAEMEAVLGGGSHAVASTADLARMPYLDAVFKEALRLTPPAPMTLRLAGEDQAVCGVFIPKGTWMQVDTRAVQTDKAVWGPDAAAFKPERWATADEKTKAVGFNAFGAGTLSCVGARFAETEAKLTLISLLRRFDFTPAGPEWVGAGRTDLDLETRLTMGPKHGVWVVPIVRGKKGVVDGGGGVPRTPTGVLGGPPASLGGGASSSSDGEAEVEAEGGGGKGGVRAVAEAAGLRARLVSK